MKMRVLIEIDCFSILGSSSAFFTSYFRVYSPIAFGKQYDPQGKYIKKVILQEMHFELDSKISLCLN